jgi:hypothetical protein
MMWPLTCKTLREPLTCMRSREPLTCTTLRVPLTRVRPREPRLMEQLRRTRLRDRIRMRLPDRIHMFLPDRIDMRTRDPIRRMFRDPLAWMVHLLDHVRPKLGQYVLGKHLLVPRASNNGVQFSQIGFSRQGLGVESCMCLRSGQTFSQNAPCESRLPLFRDTNPRSFFFDTAMCLGLSLFLLPRAIPIFPLIWVVL